MSSGSYRSNGNWGKKAVQFTLQDAERIAGAVQAFERGRRGRNPSALPRAAGGGGGGSISTATFQGQWLKGSSKIIRFGDRSTANCTNFIFDVLAYNGSRRCIVSQVGDDYTMVNVECS